jgi:hypothetical protein
VNDGGAARASAPAEARRVAARRIPDLGCGSLRSASARQGKTPSCIAISSWRSAGYQRRGSCMRSTTACSFPVPSRYPAGAIGPIVTPCALGQ